MSASRSIAIQLLLFGLVFGSAAYTYNGHAWNQISRFDSIFAFVEPGPDRGSFRIDRFILNPDKGRNTGDWANNPRHDTHYYSNKAPGPAFLGVALYAPMYHLERAAGIDPATPRWTRINAYLLNLWIGVLPLALAAVSFLRLQRRLGHLPLIWCVALTLGLTQATLLFPYATQLWGHTTAAAFVIFGLQALLARRFVWSGFFLGWSVLCEYSAVLIVSAVAVVLAAREGWRARGAWLAGGALPLALFAAYHQACFGSPLALASGFSNPLFRDHDALWGVFRFDVIGESLWGLTFSPYRGLFWTMPYLLLAFAALVALPWVARSGAWRDLRWLYALCVACVAAFAAWNIPFNGWWGGDCVGPRYQIPVLPFYGLLIYLGAVEVRARGAWRWRRTILGASLALGIVSASHMFVVSAVSPVARRWNPEKPKTEIWRNPLTHHYGALWRGELSPFEFHPIRNAPLDDAARDLGSFNLGERMGLSGLFSLLPLDVFTLLCAAALWACFRPRPRDNLS
jgi:hypothetical protein